MVPRETNSDKHDMTKLTNKIEEHDKAPVDGKLRKILDDLMTLKTSDIEYSIQIMQEEINWRRIIGSKNA